MRLPEQLQLATYYTFTHKQAKIYIRSIGRTFEVVQAVISVCQVHMQFFIKSPKKWSGQNRTSQTDFYAYVHIAPKSVRDGNQHDTVASVGQNEVNIFEQKLKEIEELQLTKTAQI